ncbi:MAG: amino acid ABC transporter substrate-binding protein [Acidobacteria bacterium]|nr:amino acid ABC transporter substrate-binding protein [Acidobacteriota bacterium]
MIRRLFMIGFLLLPLLSCNGGESAAIAKIKKDKTAYVVTVPFEAPLLYQKEQALVGLDAELAKRIVNRIGDNLQLHWMTRTYATLIPGLENGEASFGLGVLGITEANKERIQYSDPYYTSELVVAANPINKEIKSVDQLAGLKIGVREATAVQEVVQKKFPGSTVVPFKTLDDAVLALKRGEVEAIIDDRYMVAYSLDTVPASGHLEVIPGAIGSVEVAVGLPKGDEELLKIINETIAEVKQQNLVSTWINEHAGGIVAKVEGRQAQRLEDERLARQPRRIAIRVTKDENFDFDIYRLANLSFTLTNRKTGEAFQSSRIDFQQRVGVSQATIPPGHYTMTLLKYGFSAPVQIENDDPGNITINIRLRRGAVDVAKS